MDSYGKSLDALLVVSSDDALKSYASWKGSVICVPIKCYYKHGERGNDVTVREKRFATYEAL